MLLSNVGVRVEQRQRVFLGFGRKNKTRSNPATQSTYCAPNWLTIIHAVQRRVGFGARIAAGHLCLPNKSGTIAVPAFQPVVDGSSLQPMSTDGHTSLICTEAAIGFYILHMPAYAGGHSLRYLSRQPGSLAGQMQAAGSLLHHPSITSFKQ